MISSGVGNPFLKFLRTDRDVSTTGYQRQVSPGLQEYIEALSFAHYLQNGNLISYEQVQASLCGADGVAVCALLDSSSRISRLIL